MSLSGSVAIVTGGAQGIGKCITFTFIDRGVRVVVADIDEEAGCELQEHPKYGDALLFVKTDVSNEEEVKNLISTAVAKFGRLDILINNASVTNPVQPRIEELSLEHWNKYINCNLTSVFLCTKHAAKHLREARGSIVNIASTRALMSEPHTEAYSASKGGVVALTHSLANSLGPEIRVNSVLPGWIHLPDWQKRSTREKLLNQDHQQSQTETGTDDALPSYLAADLRPEDHSQHPVGRVGKGSDIAELVMFLSDSSRSGFITGQKFVCDGGMTVKMQYVE